MKNFRFDIERHFNKEMKDFTSEDYATLTESISQFTGDYINFNLADYGCNFSNLPDILSNKVGKKSQHHAKACLFIPRQDPLYKYVPPEYAESTLKNEELFFQNPIKWDDSTDCNVMSFRLDSVINRKKEYYESLGNNELIQLVWKEYERFHNELHEKLDEFRRTALVNCMSIVSPESKVAESVWKKFAVSKDQENMELFNRVPNGVCFKIDPLGLPNNAYNVTYGIVGEDRIGRIIEKQIFGYSKGGNDSIFYEIASEFLTSVFRKETKYADEKECRCALDEMGPARSCKLREGTIRAVYFSSLFEETTMMNLQDICKARKIPFKVINFRI